MSTLKQGVLARAGEWAKHLRKWGKRKFWRKHRKAEQKQAKRETEA